MLTHKTCYKSWTGIIDEPFYTFNRVMQVETMQDKYKDNPGTINVMPQNSSLTRYIQLKLQPTGGEGF